MVKIRTTSNTDYYKKAENELSEIHPERYWKDVYDKPMQYAFGPAALAAMLAFPTSLLLRYFGSGDRVSDLEKAIDRHQEGELYGELEGIGEVDEDMLREYLGKTAKEADEESGLSRLRSFLKDLVPEEGKGLGRVLHPGHMEALTADPVIGAALSMAGLLGGGYVGGRLGKGVADRVLDPMLPKHKGEAEGEYERTLKAHRMLNEYVRQQEKRSSEGDTALEKEAAIAVGGLVPLLKAVYPWVMSGGILAALGYGGYKAKQHGPEIGAALGVPTFLTAAMLGKKRGESQAEEYDKFEDAYREIMRGQVRQPSKIYFRDPEDEFTDDDLKLLEQELK